MKSLALGLLLAIAPTFAADDPGSIGGSTSRIFFLDIRGGRVLSANADGTDLKVLVDGRRKGPDGIVVDPAAGYVYWSNMGKASLDDGSIDRAALDGSGVTAIVPEGGTFTAKQMKLDRKHGKLYWSDREGMRIQRANIDGSHVETLVETGHGDLERKDQGRWCVGIALDVEKGKVYWTQKGGDNAGVGVIRRAGMEIPKGQTAADRKDIETLVAGLPEPIDIDLDLATRMMYWTDRGDAPRGNTVNRAPMDPPKKFDAKNRTDVKILTGDLKEGIGIALDLKGGRMFFTDLGGSVYSAKLDGSDKKEILTKQGSLTGIAYAEVK
ncbi:MAG: 3-hydroxyacyl-CoA dehydrogenase [Acidobacteriia bacterium]|nr:3-hydroxyacyl-CoA dehydrogenase [Terriglobia bacterium]